MATIAKLWRTEYSTQRLSIRERVGLALVLSVGLCPPARLEVPTFQHCRAGLGRSKWTWEVVFDAIPERGDQSRIRSQGKGSGSSQWTMSVDYVKSGVPSWEQLLHGNALFHRFHNSNHLPLQTLPAFSHRSEDDILRQTSRSKQVERWIIKTYAADHPAIPATLVPFKPSFTLTYLSSFPSILESRHS